jgi:endogenous inhibitor of DNA gyrase (YacG/DUF329 family)
MLLSQFAKKLECQHCYKPNKADVWPVNGDFIPFCYSTNPGEYQIKIVCPECRKEWYIVWDDNPGPIQKLGY